MIRGIGGICLIGRVGGIRFLHLFLHVPKNRPRQTLPFLRPLIRRMMRVQGRIGGGWSFIVEGRMSRCGGLHTKSTPFAEKKIIQDSKKFFFNIFYLGGLSTVLPNIVVAE